MELLAVAVAVAAVIGDVVAVAGEAATADQQPTQDQAVEVVAPGVVQLVPARWAMAQLVVQVLQVQVVAVDIRAQVEVAHLVEVAVPGQHKVQQQAVQVVLTVMQDQVPVTAVQVVVLLELPVV
jgi:hypothetical protein